MSPPKTSTPKTSATVPPQVLRIVAPSGAMETPELLPRAAQRLTDLGFAVQLDPQAQRVRQRFAGTDTQRAAALESALLDPTVDIVMAARGGYGAHRLLPLLDWKKLAKAVLNNGTKIVGHSDFTAIQMALLRHGAPSFAGPCAGVDFGGVTVNTYMQTAFLAAMRDDANSALPAKFNCDAIAANNAPLWGGNLTMLCSLVGTPYFPTLNQIKGGILFIEDVNERPFRVERALNHLYQTGILSSQSAVWWGDFGKPAPAAYDRGYGLNSVLTYARKTLGVNMVAGLPFGHVPKKCTLRIG
jgi:muramoyltetrapeptide carboxypeptidase